MKKQTKLSIMLASIALLVVSAASLVSAKGWVQVGGSWYYQNSDGDYVTESIQTSGNSKFYLGEDGAMVTDYFLESYGNGDNAYYFGSNGAMVTNTWVAIDPSIVSNQGEYVPDAYWYYFQATGKATKAGESSNGIKKVTIDGKKYAFNADGQMLTGWINGSGEVVNADDEDYPYETALYYGGGDNDGVLHSGWLAYYDSGNGAGFEDRDFMYFYFNPTNNKKIGNSEDNPNPSYRASSANNGIEYVTKKINGRTYAFQLNTGIMLIKWEGYNSTMSNVGSAATPSWVTSPWYFSAQDDGHRAQKGWVLTVPAYDIDASDYKDDEEDWFYFQGNGDMVKNQIKKINGKYYAFNESGEMKTGMILFADGEYQAKFDMDNTRGEELAKAGLYRDNKNKRRQLEWDNYNNVKFGGTTGEPTGTEAGQSGSPAAIHYFGSDGARRTGMNNIEFADEEYTFASNNSGNFEGTKSKKYYSLGIQLKASPDIRYGLMVASDSQVRTGVNYETSDFYVLNTSGAKVKGANTAKKDADGNYWLIDKTDDKLIGVYTVQVRKTTDGLFQFKGDKTIVKDGVQRTKSNTWLPFDEDGVTYRTDDTGKQALAGGKGLSGQYVVDLRKNMDYALNFYWSPQFDAKFQAD